MLVRAAVVVGVKLTRCVGRGPCRRIGLCRGRFKMFVRRTSRVW